MTARCRGANFFCNEATTARVLKQIPCGPDIDLTLESEPEDGKESLNSRRKKGVDLAGSSLLTTSEIKKRGMSKTMVMRGRTNQFLCTRSPVRRSEISLSAHRVVGDSEKTNPQDIFRNECLVALPSKDNRPMLDVHHWALLQQQTNRNRTPVRTTASSPSSTTLKLLFKRLPNVHPASTSPPIVRASPTSQSKQKTSSTQPERLLEFKASTPYAQPYPLASTSEEPSETTLNYLYIYNTRREASLELTFLHRDWKVYNFKKTSGRWLQLPY